MSNKQNSSVKFWMKANNSILLFHFEDDSYKKEEFLEEVMSLYNEWENFENADIDPELIGEIDNSTPENWILEHLSAHTYSSVEILRYSDETAYIIDAIVDSTKELNGYTNDEEYDDLERHDCRIIAEHNNEILEWVYAKAAIERRVII